MFADCYFALRTAAFNAFPARNRGTFLAGIWIGFLVLGLTPFRADLFVTRKVPNPTNPTLFPLAKESLIPLKSESTALAAAAFESLAFWATLAINSCLLIG
jgi:hypothetical protein